MTPEELQRYIHEHIPLSQSLGLSVTRISPTTITLSAPLQPNVNHKCTVFGGSLHALATLACWSLVFTKLKDHPFPKEIVISKSEVDYLRPVTEDFTVSCSLGDDRAWDTFLMTLQKRSKSRIRLRATVYQGEVLALSYWGDFVAIIAASHP